MKSTLSLGRLERETDASGPEPSPEQPNQVIDLRDREPDRETAGAAIGAENREERRQRALLQDALAMAQHASHAKSVFLANMSHDFRTPMNAIMGFTDIALNHLDDGERVHDCLLKIKQSSGHLLELLNEVLDVSRIESGKLQLNEKPMDLLDMARELHDMFQPQVQEKQLQFILDFSRITDGRVIGDPLRLTQIFVNLIGNAVKFTGPGGTVRIQATNQTNISGNYGRFTFCVVDTGCGMSNSFMDHIFEPFERDSIESVSRTEGTGLGMTITKNLIDMMGGAIDVRSRLGVGTEFLIRIPLKLQHNAADAADKSALEAAGASASAPRSEALAGKRLLVVDDDGLSREILREILQEKGLLISEAVNGEEALTVFLNNEAGAFDAILMDLHMPVLDGVETARAIRHLPRPDAAEVPIIATTAGAFEEDRRRAIDAGMNDHISKPIDVNRLVACLCEHLL